MRSLISPSSVRSAAEHSSIDRRQERGAVLEHVAGLGLGHEAARDDLRRAFTPAGLPVHDHDRHHQAVGGEMAAVAQHLVVDLAGARAVDEHPAGRHGVEHAAALGVEAHAVAVLGEQHPAGGRQSAGDHLGDAGVAGELPELAVHRHEVARPHQRQHQLELVDAAVPRDVDVPRVLGHDLDLALGQVVDHPANRPLVAGNGAGREHHGVVGPERHVPVLVDGDARQRRLRLALRSGDQADDVAGGEARDVGVLDADAGRHPQVAEALGDLRVLLHAAADERDVAIELGRQVDDELHAVDARRERGDHDLARRWSRTPRRRRR